MFTIKFKVYCSLMCSIAWISSASMVAQKTASNPARLYAFSDVDVVVSIQAADLESMLLLHKDKELKYDENSYTSHETFFRMFTQFLVNFDLADRDVSYISTVLNLTASYNREQFQIGSFKPLKLWISTTPDTYLGHSLETIVNMSHEANAIWNGTVAAIFPRFSKLQSDPPKTPLLLRNYNKFDSTASLLSKFNVLTCQSLSSTSTYWTPENRQQRSDMISQLGNIDGIICTTPKVEPSKATSVKIDVNLNGTYGYNSTHVHAVMSQLLNWRSVNGNWNFTMVAEANISHQEESLTPESTNYLRKIVSFGRGLLRLGR